ncbi:MAG: nitrite/sulfite reductase [Nitrososphaerales archaeon]
MTDIRPNLKTRPEDYSAAEKAKMSVKGLDLVIKDVNSPANISNQFMDPSFEKISDVAETLSKSYGIYTDFNRATTGEEKDWMYMLRITIPGGGPITRRQWEVLDDVAGKYTSSSTYTGAPLPSLRLTTRQNIQLHWVKKTDVIECVREIAESGFYTINGCGDNVRNVMGCPLSSFSGVYDANGWAQRAGKYFRLPVASYIEVFGIDPAYLRQQGSAASGGDGDDEGSFKYGPNLLNRKFKIAFSSIHKQGGGYVADNCVELRTNDLGIAPILEDGKARRFQVYIGGGQGEKQGYPTFAAMGQPLGIFDEAHLLRGLDAIVKVHQEWGDRQNRHWARLKYVIYKMGIEWYRTQVREASGLDFDLPLEDLDYGARHLHHGWTKQESNGLWSFGAFIENGRLIDGPNGRLRAMVRSLMEVYETELLVTPNQDLVFTNIPEERKQEFEAEMARFGFGHRDGRAYSNLRLLSGACVGRDTCRLTYTDSEKFEPSLLDALDPKWGDMRESIGITGCERQCFRPATKTIGWVGSALNMYQLKLGGTEDGRHQGGSLLDPDTGEMYLRLVPRADVPKVVDALFEFFVSDALPEEKRAGGMGYFLQRVGAKKIIETLKQNPQTSKLMARTVKNPLAREPEMANPSMKSGQKSSEG